MNIKIIIFAGLWGIQGLMASTAQEVITALSKDTPNQDEIKNLIANLGPDEINKEVVSNTPLTMATAKKNLEAIKQLLQNPNIDPNHVSAQVATPLHVAIYLIKERPDDQVINIIDTLLTYRALPIISGSFDAYSELSGGAIGPVAKRLKKRFDEAEAFAYASRSPVNPAELQKELDKKTFEPTVAMDINIAAPNRPPQVINATLLSAPIIAASPSVNVITVDEARSIANAMLNNAPALATTTNPQNQLPIEFAIYDKALFLSILNKISSSDILSKYMSPAGNTLLVDIIYKGNWQADNPTEMIKALMSKIVPGSTAKQYVNTKEANNKGSGPLTLLVSKIKANMNNDALVNNAIDALKFLRAQGADASAAIVIANTISGSGLKPVGIKTRVLEALGVAVDPQVIINDLNQLNDRLTQIKTLLRR